jgi:hypothetical protein
VLVLFSIVIAVDRRSLSMPSWKAHFLRSFLLLPRRLLIESINALRELLLTFRYGSLLIGKQPIIDHFEPLLLLQ